jgi:hypothetical protein
MPGMRQSEIVVLSERLHIVGGEGFQFCSKKCVTHFGEDSIPYHPGEKACLDRCTNKLYLGLELAKEARKQFDLKAKRNELPFRWMQELMDADK